MKNDLEWKDHVLVRFIYALVIRNQMESIITFNNLIGVLKFLKSDIGNARGFYDIFRDDRFDEFIFLVNYHSDKFKQAIGKKEVYFPIVALIHKYYDDIKSFLYLLDNYDFAVQYAMDPEEAEHD